MCDDSKSGAAYWRQIEPIWYDVSFYETWDVLRRDFEKISLKQKNLFSVYWADYEICNGGFEQFFSISTGMLAPEAITGYRAIGMVRCAELVEKACSMLGTPFPRERDERQKRLKDLLASHPKGHDAFADLEEQYYDLDDKEAGGLETAADRYALSG